MEKEGKDSVFFKGIAWVVNSFFWGIGILVGYSILQALFNKFDGLQNVFYRILFIAIIGGLAKYTYDVLSKK